MSRKITLIVLFLAFLSSATFVYAQDVFVTTQGKKYHKEGCLLIKNKDPKKISLQEATAQGLEPCQRCFKDEKLTDKSEKGKKKALKSDMVKTQEKK